MSLVKKSCNIGGVSAEIWIVEVENDKFMYGGHGVAQFLGYVKPRNALQQHVKPAWRKNWEEIKGALNQGPLVTSLAQDNIPVNWQPNTVFISEAGVYALIMRSKLPAAEEFQRWLFEEVLPELRRSGKYSIQDNQQKQQDCNMLNWANKYLQEIIPLQNQLATIRADHRNELVMCRAEFETKLRDVEQCYERQIMEYKGREHEFLLREVKYKTAIEELKRTSNMTLLEFGVNALLAKDNIEENEQLRDNIEKVKHRVIPQMSQQPAKEHYTSCFAYVKNGRKRVRVTRNQYNQVEKMDKIMEQYNTPECVLSKNTKTKQQYKWLQGADKFLQIKCPNAISLWNKVKELYPQACFGFKFTNKSGAEIEFLTAEQIVDKYRAHVKMCADNKKCDQARIARFKALDLIDEEDAVRKCLTPSVECKMRIARLIEDTMVAVENEIVPQQDGKRYENVKTSYSPDQIVSCVKNYNKNCVNNMFNFYFTAPASIDLPYCDNNKNIK
ncbi:bro [Trichoplusia ni granulovirus LBIV-12]|uniref:Bro n=1 Tax=Trichoplusia ni granulovirus LBIV-12 TaxID=1916701 RepID=A0A1D8QL75_GVTN|nr:bro [Trichoplusia ni granulovirus LBIV-12]AOW41396.1 bro [Trichoplusia ni granulovirus LBIV-12]